MSVRPRLATAIFAWLLLAAGAAYARTIEQAIQIPVEVADRHGAVVRQPITVTIFREEARARSPFLLLNHGRAARAADRAKLGRARFSDNARYFVSWGYAVFVPTRVGYGVSGGPDVENSGPCRSKDYPPVYEAAARQSVAVIDYAKTLPWIDPGEGLVVGQSFGGATAIALAAKNIPGVLGAVNFAGGGGGNPETKPGDPCRDDLLTALFAGYGARAKIPTLWLYSANDRYFGADKPRAWFQAFVARGGSGAFVPLPPCQADGHPSFTANPAAWKPAFEHFLRGR